MTKPLVYNYKVAEDRIAELEATLKRQSESIIKMHEENTDLRIEMDRLRKIIKQKVGTDK